MNEREASGRRSRARLAIGRVGAPHGLTGRVKVRLWYTGSRSLEGVERVWLVRGEESDHEYSVREVRGAGNQTLLWLEGVNDRDAAARLTGASIEVRRDELEPLGSGEYYLADLVGAAVVGPEGPLGEVVDVVVHPSIDSVRIRCTDGRLAEQPLAPPWVAAVEPNEGRIVLASLDGLIV